MLEFVPCCFCKVDNSEFLFLSGNFKIVKCKNCGLVYVNPRLSQIYLRNLYNARYFKSDTPLTFGYEDYIKDYDNIARTFKKRWLRIKRHLKNKGRVLDIGCAYGFLLKYLKEMGYEVYGIEISEQATQYAKLKYGLNVINKPLKQAGFLDNFFDVVTVWDVIEHFPDPQLELLEIYRILKPNGILSIITPDSGSIQAKIWGKNWVEYLRPDEHIFFFSKKLLISEVKKLGFEVVDNCTAGKYVSVKFVLDRLKAYNKFFFTITEMLLKMIGLTERVFYCDPKDKMFVNFRKL